MLLQCCSYVVVVPAGRRSGIDAFSAVKVPASPTLRNAT